MKRDFESQQHDPSALPHKRGRSLAAIAAPLLLVVACSGSPSSKSETTTISPNRGSVPAATAPTTQGPETAGPVRHIVELPELEANAFEALQAQKPLLFFNGVLEVSQEGKPTFNVERPFVIPKSKQDDASNITLQDLKDGKYAFGYYNRSDKPGVTVFGYNQEIMTLAAPGYTTIGEGNGLADLNEVIFPTSHPVEFSFDINNPMTTDHQLYADPSGHPQQIALNYTPQK